MRLADLLRDAARRLGEEGQAEATALLCHVVGRPAAWLWGHGDEPAAMDLQHRFEGLLQRRLAGEPVAYLTGTRGFWRFELAVSPDTLIPRPETERLVELALERLPTDRRLRLLDLGTGSGAIALALAFERPLATVVAVERSAGAAVVARRNAKAQGLEARVDVREVDWFAPVAGERFDLIASNPPYIEGDDPHLGLGDLRFEPRGALASGADGLDDLRVIVEGAGSHLVAGGGLVVEHGWRQGAAVRALLAGAGFLGVATVADLEGRERVSLGVRPDGTRAP